MSDTQDTTETQAHADGAYRVLARKYRPRDFSDLIGQEPMVRTLTNAFKSGRIAQAWMLTGVRGVGKTTTARILARALNYETDTVNAPSIDLATPGVHCAAIMEGRHVDVVEMDAASHTGVDNMRDILEQVRYRPTSARYKVYIIDEVHMLSGGAFNAMLKTLEEPPPHVKFIFATTEIRKVPITVLSRCQRFDLRRVEAGVLMKHLAEIADKEKVTTDADALGMIARAAEGSVRDSLSILDQAIAHGGGEVTTEAVRSMLGLADRARVIDLFEHLMKGDLPAALAEFRSQYDAGADPVVVLNDLARFNHLVTRLRFVPEAADDASLSEDERTRGGTMSGELPVRALSRAWQMLLRGISEVEASNQPYAAAEMVLVRIAHAADLPTLDEAIRQAGESAGTAPAAPATQRSSAPPPQNGGGAHAVAAGRMTTAGPGGQTMRLVEHSSDPAPAARAEVGQAEPDGDAVPLASLEDIVALADARRDMAFKVMVKRCVRLVSIEPGRIEVGLTDDAPKTLLGDITRKLTDWTGRRWVVSLSHQAGAQTLAEIERAAHETRLLDARSDPAVAAILARFPGARITDVRIPDAEVGDELAPAPEPDGDDDEL